jgi:transcriptional regulator with XRE-family HTH domain
MQGHSMKKSPNPVDKYVGNRVRMRRLMLNMSQEKLGGALGLTFQQVQKCERGTNRIGASRLQHISHILQVPVAFFSRVRQPCIRRSVDCRMLPLRLMCRTSSPPLTGSPSPRHSCGSRSQSYGAAFVTLVKQIVGTDD